MTSLIFGSIYLSHKTIVAHRRAKQRQKNYERWEDLRDEYDDQRRISSDSPSRRSAEFDGDDEVPEPGRPILTLRDQQEAGDARTGWRPQERWDPQPVSRSGSTRKSSAQIHRGPDDLHSRGPSAPVQRSHKTGSTWDEDLPPPLQVTRRSFEDYSHPTSTSSSASPPQSSRLNQSPIRQQSISSHTSSTESLTLPNPAQQQRVADVEVVESPFEWWKQ